MQIEVRKGETVTTHVANLLVPIRSERSIMIQLIGDSRPISRIAADFEEPDDIITDDGRSFPEYKEPIVVYRVDTDTVQIRIREVA